MLRSFVNTGSTIPLGKGNWINQDILYAPKSEGGFNVRKWKHMPCFEVGLSPKGLTHPQDKVYSFAFHGLACVTIQSVRHYEMDLFLETSFRLEDFTRGNTRFT